MCRHNSLQQLRFQPDYLRVTTDVIHKTGECYIGFSTNKALNVRAPASPMHGLFLKPEYMLDKATSWIFSYCLEFLIACKRTVTVALLQNYRIHLMLFTTPLSDITGVQIQVLAFVFSSRNIQPLESCTSADVVS